MKEQNSMDNQNLQRTLAIIKPDAFAQKLSGKIIDRIEQEDFSIIGIKVLHVSPKEAAQFYAVHTGKPFFDELVAFLSSGKIMVLALKGIEAIALWRKVMGATDPAKADEGTIRKLYGSSIGRNACHGSDAPETAETESNFFFKPEELVP